MADKPFIGAQLLQKHPTGRLNPALAIGFLADYIANFSTGMTQPGGLGRAEVYTELKNAPPDAEVWVCTREEIVKAIAEIEGGKYRIYLVGKDWSRTLVRLNS